jgi:hypothetical protein
MRHEPLDSVYGVLWIEQQELPMRSAVLHVSVAGELESEAAADERAAWSIGYDLTTRRVEFDGDPRHLLLRVESARSRRTWETPTAGLWASRRWRSGDRLTVEPGLRIDGGPAIAGAGRLRAMPRLQARFAVDSQTMLSAGVGRSYQYTQAIGRVENGLQALMYPAPLWLGADDSTPPLRTDVATLGLERWLGATWLVAANAYGRRSAGYLLPDPTPGPIRDRGAVVVGRERATGLELSARKLGGRVTGAAAYSYGIARTSTEGFDFPSNQDRRHALDLSLLVRLRPSLQFSSAFTAASGAPYTRMQSTRGPSEPYAYFDETAADSMVAGLPNGVRKPAFASLDLALDWSFSVYGVRAATFVQLRNVLMRDNPGVYFASRLCEGCKDLFLINRSTNVPLPVIGLRARF